MAKAARPGRDGTPSLEGSRLSRSLMRVEPYLALTPKPPIPTLPLEGLDPLSVSPLIRPKAPLARVAFFLACDLSRQISL